MLIDNSLILDDNLALTTTGSSTNYIDTVGSAGGQAQISGVNSIQGGNDAYEQIWWEVLVRTTMVGTNGMLDFQLWTSEAIANIWTTGNAGSVPTAAPNTVKLNSTGPIAVANLISSAGKANAAYVYQVRIAQGLKRYLSSFYIVSGINSVANGGTGGFASGKIDSKLVPDIDINLT